MFVFNFAAYCVVAVESVGRQIPIAFLERVKEDFTKRYGGGKAATAAASSLNRDFGYLFIFHLSSNQYTLVLLVVNHSHFRSKLKEHMQYCVDHPEEISKLAKVKAQVSEVKGVMMENIEKVWCGCLSLLVGNFPILRMLYSSLLYRPAYSPVSGGNSCGLKCGTLLLPCGFPLKLSK